MPTAKRIGLSSLAVALAVGGAVFAYHARQAQDAEDAAHLARVIEEGEQQRRAAMARDRATGQARPAVPPRIGMSARDALDSLWGKPDAVNATTTAAGTREQWVYRSWGYLYIEGGQVVAIQERR